MFETTMKSTYKNYGLLNSDTEIRVLLWVSWGDAANRSVIRTWRHGILPGFCSQSIKRLQRHLQSANYKVRNGA